MVLKCSFVDDTGKENWHVHCSGLVEQRALEASRVIFRCSKMESYLVVTLGERDNMVAVEVLQNRAL